MRKTDTCGLDLVGAIDGSNRAYRTALPMVDGQTDVYLNGRLKVSSLDDGYTVTDDRTVTLKEAPLPGDTVQVSYATGSSAGGQAGGVPCAPEVVDEASPGVEVLHPACPEVEVRLVAPPSVEVIPSGRGCA